MNTAFVKARRALRPSGGGGGGEWGWGVLWLVLSKMHNKDNLHLQINSEITRTSELEKLLGVKADPTLSWSAQIDQVCSSISFRLYRLSKIKMKLFCNGYILHLTDYYCIIWGNSSKDTLKRTSKLQKRAARHIFDTDPLAPSESLFKELRWMPAKTRIQYHKL